jgi:hypothetical protein
MLFIVHYFALPKGTPRPLSLSLSLSLLDSSFNYCFETMVIIIVGGSSGFKLRRDFDATTTTTRSPPRMHANSPPTLQPMPARKQEEDPQHTLSPWTYYKLIC